MLWENKSLKKYEKIEQEGKKTRRNNFVAEGE